MAEHFVKVVDDGTLQTRDGWAFARDETGCIYFVAERSALCNEVMLSEAWEAARQLVIEQAVASGEVQWRRQHKRARGLLRAVHSPAT